jgi:hypothetical protein
MKLMPMFLAEGAADIAALSQEQLRRDKSADGRPAQDD